MKRAQERAKIDDELLKRQIAEAAKRNQEDKPGAYVQLLSAGVPSPQPAAESKPAEPGEHDAAVLEALKSARARIVEAQQANLPPETVYRRLSLLGDELSRTAREQQSQLSGDYLSRRNRLSGMIEGRFNAAGAIITFLNEPVDDAEWNELRRLAVTSTRLSYPSAKRPSAEVMLIVNLKGAVTRAYYRSGDEGLGQAAARTLKRWRFHPYQADGIPVDVKCRISVRAINGRVVLTSQE
jgi:hypothetical protein